MIITAELRLQFLKTFGFNPEDMPVLKELNEENEQLKEQIESLKCCGNCDNHDYTGYHTRCSIDLHNIWDFYDKCDKWQPKEKK